jgi:hypothetical protein
MIRKDERKVAAQEFVYKQLGLSLKALLPAAAWYFIIKVYRFFALWGEKTRVPSGRQGTELDRQAKVLI